MAAHASRGGGITGFFLGLIVAALIAVCVMVWPQFSREPPLRTVEVTIPTPEIPAPPGTIPESREQPAAQ